MTPPLLTLRTFLAENGAPLPPWSAPAAVVDALCGLTAARRGDPRYIKRLLTLERGCAPICPGSGPSTTPRWRASSWPCGRRGRGGPCRG